MKELSIEEKAKRYDEAIEKGKQIQNTPYTAHWDIMKEVAEHLFPELAESEDEKIRKDIINYLNVANQIIPQFQKDKWIAWLEKQGKQKLNPVLNIEIPFGAKDSELKEASYYIPEGFHAEIDGNRVVIKRGEQNPTNKVEPKFKQGDIIKEKETGNLFYVNSVENFGYTLHYKDCIEKGCVMSFKYEDNYELVEHTPAWSEEDEINLKKAIWYVENPAPMVVKDSMLVEWLKSLRPQSQWRPSDEQMTQLGKYCPDNRPLTSLYEQLKKIKG